MEIAELEAQMRAGHMSGGGFLGATDSLPATLEKDRKTLDRLGLSAAELADALERVLLLGMDHYWEHDEGQQVGKFVILIAAYRGFQECPWGCPAEICKQFGFVDFTLTNTETGESIQGPGLITHLIRDHEFFEGPGSPYRVDPETLARVLGLALRSGSSVRTPTPGAQPSQTALFTALRRALAHAAYHHAPFGPDDLAIHFLPAQQRFLFRFHRVRQYGERKLDEAMPGMTPYIIARTAWLDRLFLDALNEGVPQVVILGAGYDTRGWRFASSNPGSAIYELDAAETQARKQQCLASAGIAIPPAVKLVPIDFMAESPGEALVKAGFRPDAKTLFLWEGVSYYLDAASVDRALAFARSTGEGASAIAFDYTVPLTGEDVRDSYGTSAFLEAMRSYHADEALMFAIPDGEIGPFLAARGLQVVEHYDAEGIEDTFLCYGQGALLGHITGNFRFVVARPAS